jgi:hypothetical protein
LRLDRGLDPAQRKSGGLASRVEGQTQRVKDAVLNPPVAESDRERIALMNTRTARLEQLARPFLAARHHRPPSTVQHEHRHLFAFFSSKVP